MSNQRTLDLVRQIGNVVVIPLAVLYNFLGREGEDVGDVARRGEPILAAAGWAFSIWGVIFAGQVAYAIYQAFPRERTRSLHRRIGWLTMANGFLGAFWTFAFTHQLFALAWVTMLTLLAVLIGIELRLGNEARAGRDFWLARLTYGVNLGWITVATLLNTTQFLAWSGYDGEPLTPLLWSYVLVVVATLLGVLMIFVRRNEPFALAVAWGLVGIAVYRADDFEGLAAVSALCAIVLVLAAIVELGIRRFRPNLLGRRLRRA